MAEDAPAATSSQAGTGKRIATRARFKFDPKAEAERCKRLAKVALTDAFGPGEADAARFALVYAEAGVGKTTFLAEVPGVTFLDLERSASQMPWLPRRHAPIDSLDDLYEALAQLRYSPHDYRALAIETLPHIDDLILAALDERIREAGKSIKGAPTSVEEANEQEFGAGGDLVRDEWKRLLAYLDDLRAERKMAVYLSAPVKATRVPMLDGQPEYLRAEPQITDKSKKARALVHGAVHYILHLGVDVTVAKAGAGKGARTFATFGERWLYTTHEATHLAKARGGVPWPRRLPLVPGASYRLFDRLAGLLAGTPAGIPEGLWEKGMAAAARIGDRTDPATGKPETGEDRRLRAMDALKTTLEEKDWVKALAVLDAIEEAAGVTAAVTTKSAS